MKIILSAQYLEFFFFKFRLQAKFLQKHYGIKRIGKFKFHNVSVNILPEDEIWKNFEILHQDDLNFSFLAHSYSHQIAYFFQLMEKLFSVTNPQNSPIPRVPLSSHSHSSP